MAAAYTVIGSKFKPYSFEEYIQPLNMYKQAYEEVESGISDLDIKAGVWENVANEQADPRAYQMFKKYSEDLRKQADTLATEGLTQTSRKNLMRMRGRYSQEITPIEQAYTRRRQLADEQRKALSENPTLMYQRDANTMSLDDFIANPEIDYGASYSGALLAKQAGDMASNLARSMRSDPRQWSSILNGQYWQTMQKSGYTPEEIILAAQFDPNAPKELRTVIDQVYKSSGIDSWADNATKERAINYIIEGLYNSIGTTKYDTLKNEDYLNPYERWKMNQGAGEPTPPEVPIFYDYVGTELNINEDKNLKQLNEDLKNLRAYKEQVNRGEKVEQYIERESFQSDPYNPRGKPYKVHNPIYFSYDNLAKQYGTSDIDALIKNQERAINKATNVNKYAKFKNAQSDLAMRELRAALLSGVTDWSSNKEVRKRIHKLGDSKTAPDKDTIEKIFSDSGATIQFNPVTGKAIIEGKYGIYEIDKSAAFHNIGVPTPIGVVPGDEFMRMITDFAQSPRYDTNSMEAMITMDNMLNTFFGALYNSYNGGAPEASKTSSKVSTFPLQ